MTLVLDELKTSDGKSKHKRGKEMKDKVMVQKAIKTFVKIP